jgi:hypothetical protein
MTAQISCVVLPLLPVRITFIPDQNGLKSDRSNVDSSRVAEMLEGGA